MGISRDAGEARVVESVPHLCGRKSLESNKPRIRFSSLLTVILGKSIRFSLIIFIWEMEIMPVLQGY